MDKTKRARWRIMRFGTERAGRDTEYAQTELFIEKCKRVATAFTRKRKLTLYAMLMTLLERKGLTLSMEIRGFAKMGIIEGTVSKVAYLKQRQRLNPEALLDLCQFHNRGLYDDGEMKNYKGYLLLAADGSSINVPTTLETLTEYGTSSRKGAKPQAALGLSCLFDVVNKTILTCTINRNKFNEAVQAEKHLAQLPQLVGERKSILTLDRGYPSLPLLLRLNQQNQKYVVRLSSTNLKKEQLALTSNDEVVDVVIDRSRLQHYKGTTDYDLLASAGKVTLRIVKVTLDSGDSEYLATNLSSDVFSSAEISKLYAARWGIETAFDVLKNKLALENFTGTKPILIEQDIYSSIYISNLAHDLISDAEDKLTQASADRPVRKHPMAVNRAFAIGILKELFIIAVLTDDPERKSALFSELTTQVQREVLPVRPDRQFVRTKGVLCGKYSNTHKRLF